MNTQFNNAFQTLELKRFPLVKNQNLQAWDAADEYLLNQLKENNTELKDKEILIFNDAFGALSLPLLQYQPNVLTDSIISEKAIINNAQLNQLNNDNIKPLNSLSKHRKTYDMVLIKIPKTLDYLRYFIISILPHIHDKSLIIAAGMVRNMPKTLWQIFTELLGETHTSLAKKKAKLITIIPNIKSIALPQPAVFKQENTELSLYNYANVFSKQSLDIGTRFLLQNLPQLNNISNIIDLGCGNGIIGLNLALQYPNATVSFVDESYMAVASAKLSCENNLSSAENCQFKVNNCLDGFTPRSSDLIVCNPPFHQAHSIGTHIASQMFNQSFKTLKTGGILIVVANRHLPYHSQLKRLFGHVNTIASNAKFLVFSMKKIA